MKKKILSLLMAATLVVGMTGCVQKPGSEGSDAKDGDKGGKGGYELALITDVGTIDDKSFNQGTWEGLEKYAKDNNLTHKYYKPTEKSDEACMNAIDLAVKGGAKVIATPGFLFEYPIMEAQTKYPDVSFILVDAEPKDKKCTDRRQCNVYHVCGRAGRISGWICSGDRRIQESWIYGWYRGTCGYPLWIWIYPGSRCGSKRYGTQSRGHQNEIYLCRKL